MVQPGGSLGQVMCTGDQAEAEYRPKEVEGPGGRVGSTKDKGRRRTTEGPKWQLYMVEPTCQRAKVEQCAQKTAVKPSS